MNDKPLKFISLEGIEGVGKSTATAATASTLASLGYETTVTREPGGTEIGEEIRSLLLKPERTHITPLSELMLLNASRAQHIEEIILPALKKGKFDISDRFTDASFAYQGAGRGLDLSIVQTISNLVTKTLKPSLTFLLDAPASVGLSRVVKRNRGLDRFEKENLEFFERIRKEYLRRAHSEPERFFIIDASTDEETVQNKIELVIKERFK